MRSHGHAFVDDLHHRHLPTERADGKDPRPIERDPGSNPSSIVADLTIGRAAV